MKKSSPSLAKLSPPRLPKIVERQRLFKELDRAKNYSITWITAPAGMGKTTLIASYLKTRKLKPLWYQIDEGDADPATLFQFLGAAAGTMGKRKKDPLPSLTPEFLPSLPTFARRFFEAMYARLRSSRTIVFDNFHELPTEAPTQDLLALAGDTLPQGYNLYFLSRTPPPPVFAKLLADRYLTIIEADSLLFSLDETIQMCGLQTSRTVPATLKAKAENIHHRTNGWVAGMILLLESARRPLDKTSTTLLPSDTVFHYLAREVFEGFPRETQQVLLKTAYAPFVTPEIAEALTQLPQASVILHNLYRTRSFVERHHTGSTCYRYHPLFHEFLKTLAQEQLSNVESEKLLETTAQLLEAAGETEEALTLWQIKGDDEKVISIIKTQAPMLVQHGRLRVLQEWIEALPSDTFKQEPWLQYWHGVCQFPFDPLKAKQSFIQSSENFLSTRDPAGSLLALCRVIQTITNLWQDLSELDPWIDRLSSLLQNHDLENLPPELQATLASTVVQALMWRKPHDPTIDQWIERAQTHLQHLESDFQRGLLFLNLTSFFCWRGQQDRAISLLQSYPDARVSEHRPFEKVLFLLSQAHTHWYCGECAKGLQFAEQAYELLHTHQASAHWEHFIHANRVYYGLTTDDIPQARHAIQKLQPLVSNLPGVVKAHFRFMAAWVSVAEKRFREAFDLLQGGLEHVVAMGVSQPEADFHLAMADILLEGHQPQKAIRHIEKGLEVANQIPSPMQQFKGLLLKSRVHREEQQEKDFSAVLQEAFALGREYQIEITTFWRPDIIAELCVQALRHDIEVGFVRHLIRARNLMPDESPLAIPHWPWRVTMTTLGDFSIAIDERPLVWSRKAQRRPLLFLKALISLGGRHVSETTLSEALWPDAEGDVSHQAFATTLHRLRKLLKHDHAIQLQDKKVSLNPSFCWVDTFAFESLVQKAKTQEAQGHSQEASQLHRQALALYQGSFLEDELDEAWTFRFRDQLRTTYIRTVLTYTDSLEQKGQLDDAFQHLEQAVNLESLAEPLYQQLIGLLKSQGRDLEADALAQRLQRELKTQLGIEKMSRRPTGRIAR